MPVLNLSATSGPVGTTIFVSGVASAAGPVTISCPSLGLTASATAAATTFAYTSTLLGRVPLFPRGAYPVTATDSNSPAQSLTVNFAITPQIVLSATGAVFVGDTLTVTGSGFTGNSVVSLSLDGSPTVIATGYGSTIGTLMVSSVNSSALTFALPDAARGIHTLTASDVSLATASVNFSVASKLIITPTMGSAGDSVNIIGTGFGNGQVAVSFEGSAQTTNPITTSGRFTATFQVPAASYGPHQFVATDATGSASIFFSWLQKITLNTASAGVGDSLTINGNGFGPSELITYKLDGNPLTVSAPSVQSLTNGNLPNVSFVVPSLPAGIHTITVSDTDQNTASAAFTILAKLAVTPNGGTAGSQATVTGSGFNPNNPVSIFWDSSTIPVISSPASATGTISVTITIPASARGFHSVKASDTLNSAAAASFTVSSKITISPTSGGYGDSVNITFSGFAANSPISGVKIISGGTPYDLATVPAAIQTDPFGSITAKFAIPGLPNGTWVIQATDAGGSAQANLGVTQKITLSSNTGSAGDNVVVIGTGFKVSTGIELKYGGTAVTVAPGVSTDTNGGFQAQLVIPKTVAGVVSVSASDGTNSAAASFNAAVKATINTVTNQTNPGFVGQNMSVSGTGFAAGGVITVTFESAPVTVAIVSADATGYFTASFKVPTAPSGPHTIHVSDGTTTKDFSYFMDSAAPAAPKPAMPADKSKPKQPVPFTWSAVTDQSGVAYTLQISQDQSFAKVILEKTGLTTAQYLMTTAEKLKSAGAKTPYYWRVKATDLAGNVSPWSTANTFTIGFIWPSWIIYVWSGLAIIVALALGIWLGRRMASPSS